MLKIGPEERKTTVVWQMEMKSVKLIVSFTEVDSAHTEVRFFTLRLSLLFTGASVTGCKRTSGKMVCKHTEAADLKEQAHNRLSTHQTCICCVIYVIRQVGLHAVTPGPAWSLQAISMTAQA